VTLDTSSNCAFVPETYWKNWVVVWVEDTNNMVAELTDHGLVSQPAGIRSFQNPYQVPILLSSNDLGI
jgi:hypothetical protein